MAEDNTLDPGVGGGDGGAGGGGEAPAPESSRDDVARAFEQVEARETAADPAAPAPAGDRARGPDGRFAPGAPAGKPAEKLQDAPGPAQGNGQAKPDPGAQQRAPGPAPAPVPGADPLGRPPVSWKPQARESWAKLPAEVRQEVTRREQEVGRVMQESSKAREALQSVQQLMGPYSHNIQASGSDALGFLGNFLKADNTLRHGAMADKAQLVASIIQQYGVDIQALDTVLAGQSVQPDPNEQLARQLRDEMQRQLQPVMGFFNQMQGRQAAQMQQLDSEVATEVTQFREQAEFFEDVRQDMADIMDLYTARKQPISLQQAYDRAILMHPQISEVVSRRAEAGRVSNQAQAAQRARRAAASITSSPAPAGSPGLASDDRRSVIEAAWDASGS